jgi:crotonobetaine/carnitine-CoA ligase
VTERAWIGDAGDERTVVELLHARLEGDPDGEYLDVVGTKLSAGSVADSGRRIAAELGALGVQRGDRVATLVDNCPEAVLAWWGTILAGAVAVPINTAYKGESLRHQLADSGSKVLLFEPSLRERVDRIEGKIPTLEHVVDLGDVRPPQLERQWLGLGQAGPDEGSLALAHVQQAGVGQHPHRFADRRPPDAELGHQGRLWR